jgi:hypothetical protein
MPQVNTFSLQPNIIMKSAEFPLHAKLFDEGFYRYGITSTYICNNISFKSSVLYCLDSNFHNMTPENISVSPIDITTLSNEVHINIIIFDFKNDLIYCSHFGDFMNPWRPTILLAKYEEWWEPIVTKDLKIFSFSSNKSNVLKNNILSQNIYKYNTKDLITINDNFNEIIDIDGFVKPSVTSPVDIFIMPDIKKTKLEKMKKDDLIQLCNNMNKPIKLTKPTKKDLIKIICS